MNKFLMTIKVLLLIILFILNYFALKTTRLTSWGHVLYILFTLIYAFQIMKDIKRKNKINENKLYQILSIFVFTIMSVVSLRVVADKSFIYNNKEFREEYLHYCEEVYGPLEGGAYYDEGWQILYYYMRQNTIYFNSMFLLLFLYRWINMDKKKRKNIFLNSDFWKYKGIM